MQSSLLVPKLQLGNEEGKLRLIRLAQIGCQNEEEVQSLLPFAPSRWKKAFVFKLDISLKLKYHI